MTAKIKIYTNPTCSYCQQAKDFFQTHKIKYEEIDVTVNEHARQEMIEKSNQMGVPVIIIGKKIIVGFNKPKLKKALEV